MPGMRKKTRSVAATTSEECQPTGKFSSQSGGLGFFVFVAVSFFIQSVLCSLFTPPPLSPSLYHSETVYRAANGSSYLPPESRVHGGSASQDTAGHLISIGARNAGYREMLTTHTTWSRFWGENAYLS